jgi:hypothetical protein
VFQTVVKPKGHSKENLHERYDDVLEAIAVDEPLEQMLNIYSEFIMTAVSLYQKRTGNTKLI